MSEGKTVKFVCVGRKARDGLRREFRDQIVESFLGLSGKTRLAFADAAAFPSVSPVPCSTLPCRPTRQGSRLLAGCSGMMEFMRASLSLFRPGFDQRAKNRRAQQIPIKSHEESTTILSFN